MLVLQCQCGKTLSVPEGSHARKGVCPNCGEVMNLPRMATAAAVEPRRMGEWQGHQGPIRCAVFSRDGQLLATGAGSEESGEELPARFAEIRLWDVAKGRVMAAMQGHQDAVLCATFSPDCQTLITGSQDRTMIVWDTSRGLHNVVLGLKQHTLRGHKGSVGCVSISPDGAQLISADDEGEIRLWDTERWRCEQVIETGRSGVCRLTHSPDGAHVAAVWQSAGPAMLWNARTWEEYLRLVLWPEDDGEDFGLAFSPDGAFLAVLSENLLRIWDLSSCQVTIAIEAAGARSMAFSPDGRLLATAGWDLKTRFDVQLWDPLSGQALRRLGGQHNALYTVGFSPDGNRLACGGRDLAVHVWEV